MTVLGDKVFEESVVRMWTVGWALVRSDWCFYQKRIGGHRETPEGHVHRGQCLRRPSASHRQRSQKKPNFPGTLILDFIRPLKKYISVVEASQSLFWKP